MGTASQTLAGYVAELRFGDLPDEVTRAATRHLLDACGVALAAAATGQDAPVADMIRSWAGAREASVVGYDYGAPAPWAAMVNGALTHTLEFDDTHVESLVHPSSFVMPAALAVGEEVGASGRDVLLAAVAGYEVGARLGAAAPGRFEARGLDATGICGTFGAAAVAAKLWGLNAEDTAGAFGIAGSRSSGLFTLLPDGSDAKRLLPGWAAHAGIIAADLARRGAAGPNTIFEEPHGLYHALLNGEEPDPARITAGLGTVWETTRIAIRPYPACDHLHAFIDAAQQANVKWADIDEVEAAVAPAVIGIVAEPRATRLRPATTHAAQFSLPFTIGSVIVGGRDGIELFEEEARHDRRVLMVAERVHVIADPTLPFPQAYGGRLSINTRGGRTLEIDELVNRGHPDRPLDDDELRQKFLANARRRLGARGARRALVALERIAEADAIEEVTATLRTP